MAAGLAILLVSWAQSWLSLPTWSNSVIAMMMLVFALAWVMLADSGWSWIPAYWAMVWLAWWGILLVLPLSWLANVLVHDSTVSAGLDIAAMTVLGNSSSELAVLSILALLSVMRSHSITTWTIIPSSLGVLVGGPALALSRFILHRPDPKFTDASHTTTSSWRQDVALVLRESGYFAWVWPLVWSAHPWMVTAVQTWLPSWVAVWAHLSLAVCTSLLILSVLELNIVFNIRFANFVAIRASVANSPVKAAYSTVLFHSIINLIIALAILVFIAIGHISLAWTIHLIWLATDS
jgi:hypothetical protein